MPERLVTVEVHASTLFKTGHMANRWFRGIALQLGDSTRLRAPVRSGALEAGISTEVNAVPRALQMTMTWSSSANHTLFVLRGTGDGIRTHRGWAEGIGEGTSYVLVPSHGGFMQRNIGGFWMHFGGYGHPWVYKDEVRGQSANNFLLKGWTTTARRHRAMALVPSFVLHP